MIFRNYYQHLEVKNTLIEISINTFFSSTRTISGSQKNLGHQSDTIF